MKRAHLICGLLGLLAFAGTGQVMRHMYGVPAAEPLLRALYRSSHLYLFFAALLNTVLGLHYTVSAAGWRRKLQIFGSLMLLASVPTLLVLFFVEPGAGHLDRPFTRLTILLFVPAVLAHLIAARGVKS